MKILKLYLVLFLLTGMFWSCQKDEISSESIFKDSTKEKTEFDKWLLSNYTYPYNIEVKYKMEDIESDYTVQLVPAETDKCIAMAKLIKYLWLETFIECKDVDFMRSNVPRVIHLIGSGAYSSTGAVTLGTAEDGMKITLYAVNQVNPANPSIMDLRDRMRTCFHEFSHILHQKKNYTTDFWKITNNDYVYNDWSQSINTLQIAYQKGFVSQYARKEPDEDFVETLARYVVYGQDNWDSILNAAGPDGASKITQKLDIVRDYLNVSWGIDIDQLRWIFESRLGNINNLDLTHL